MRAMVVFELCLAHSPGAAAAEAQACFERAVKVAR